MEVSQTVNTTICEKRKYKDVQKLMISDYKVTQSEIMQYDLVIEFNGPKNSLYEGGTWEINVCLPQEYPYKSPSIGFKNKIYHPNIDEASGSICLDVLNQTWSPMFDLLNIVEVFLPQLLLYPNPTSPLNADAASLMSKDIKQYNEKVKQYVNEYAMKKQDKILQMQQQGKSLQMDKPIKKYSDASTALIDEEENLDLNFSDIIYDNEECLSNISNISNLSITSQILCNENF